MKHIISYPDWLNESSERRLEDLERLVNLGLAEPDELGQLYRTEFISKLMELFRELNIKPVDRATARQRANGTLVIQLRVSDVAKLLSKVRYTQGLGVRQLSSLQKTVRELEPYLERLEKMNFTRHQLFTYFIFKSSIRYAIWPGYRYRDWDPQKTFNSTSNRIVDFSYHTRPEEALARFIYWVSLDAKGSLSTLFKQED